MNLNFCFSDKYRVYASVAFMVVVIIIGVPMWWKTTEVYRVPLPYAEIDKLKDVTLKAGFDVGIFTFNPDNSKTIINKLEAHYKDNEIWNIKFIHILNVKDAENSKTPATLESKILKMTSQLNTPGSFLIYEWPKLMNEDILITSERSALVKNTISLDKIIQLFDLYILQTYKIRNILDEQKIGYKSSPAQPNYDVLISVLNPLPEKMDIKWNIRLASEIYLKPFFHNINQVSNFVLKTQWKYQIAFDFPLKQVKLAQYYAVSKTTLPHIITSIEKNLGQSISDNSRINIIVYVPSCDIAPIYIHDENDKRVSNNTIDSFISPKWGSVIIYNPPIEQCTRQAKTSEKINFHINSNDVMQIVLLHLQKILEINTDIQTNGIKVVDNEQITPRLWEYDAYIRKNAISHIFTANRTLRSLIQLLDNISYIVINDDVGKAVTKSYENILLAKDYLLLSDGLLNASRHAKEAFISSEKAFFDASLLAQLYFPDEQKYAVYIPLFLPIMVPVITSIAALKRFYTIKTKSKED